MGLTLAEDQQLAGLLMWIPAGFVYLAAIAILFVLWLKDAERRSMLNVGRFSSITSLVLAAALLAGCNDGKDGIRAAVTGGDPRQGAADIVGFGCGSCHIIPGMGLTAWSGCRSTNMGRRIFIVGLLRNTPDNMIVWLRDPQMIAPGNAMPDMGLNDDQARDITAYLYTLQ